MIRTDKVSFDADLAPIFDRLKLDRIDNGETVSTVRASDQPTRANARPVGDTWREVDDAIRQRCGTSSF
jgi:hypothetical protein